MKNAGYIAENQSLKTTFDFIGDPYLKKDSCFGPGKDWVDHECVGGTSYYGMKVVLSEEQNILEFSLYFTNKGLIAVRNEHHTNTEIISNRTPLIEKFVEKILMEFVESEENRKLRT